MTKITAPVLTTGAVFCIIFGCEKYEKYEFKGVVKCLEANTF